MRNLPRFHFLPLFLLVGSLGTAACSESPKMVAVANETGEQHDVQFGATNFGSVAAGTVSQYDEVGDGEQAVRVDGTVMWTDSLGSDNVGGSWTLYLQEVSGQLLVGVSSDE